MLPLLLLVANWLVIPTVTIGQESEQVKAYAKHWADGEYAFANRDYKAAFAHSSKAASIFPYDPGMQYRLSRCLALLGENDKALANLETAISYGWANVDAMNREPDWDHLRKDPRFIKLLKDTATCRDEEVTVYAGKKVVSDKPAPVLVLLHGLGSGPRSELPYWKQAADELGLVVVAPRAVTRIGPILYGWHREGAKDSNAADYFNLDGARKQVDAALAEAARKYSIKQDAIILAGYSQGGGVALQLIARQPDRFLGAIAINSLCQSLDKTQLQALARQGQKRIHLIAGEYDKLLPRSKSVAESLKEVKIPFRFDIIEKSGHEYTADSPTRIQAAVRFVLTGE